MYCNTSSAKTIIKFRFLILKKPNKNIQGKKKYTLIFTSWD